MLLRNAVVNNYVASKEVDGDILFLAQSVGIDMTAPCVHGSSLRKHAYSNKLKILPPKKMKIYRRGSSNEYPQSMFLSEIRKIMYTPVNPSFTV